MNNLATAVSIEQPLPASGTMPVHASRILIIDDEQSSIYCVSKVLAAYGFQDVEGLTNPLLALDAWRLLADNYVDLIFDGRLCLFLCRLLVFGFRRFVAHEANAKV